MASRREPRRDVAPYKPAPAERLPLSPLEEKFLRAYLPYQDIDRAAVAAGLDVLEDVVLEPHVARQRAENILRRSHVQLELNKRMERHVRDYAITRERIEAELGKMAFANVQNLIGANGTVRALREMHPDDAAAIKELEVEELRVGGVTVGVLKKLKMHDKRAALRDLGDSMGMFKNQVEVTGKDGGPLEVLMAQINADPKNRIGPK